MKEKWILGRGKSMSKGTEEWKRMAYGWRQEG